MSIQNSVCRANRLAPSSMQRMEVIGVVEFVRQLPTQRKRTVVLVRQAGAYSGMLRCVFSDALAELALVLAPGDQIAMSGKLRKFANPRKPFDCEYYPSSLHRR
jgi:hypothetical protein